MFQTDVVETTKGFLCLAQFFRMCYGLWDNQTLPHLAAWSLCCHPCTWLCSRCHLSAEKPVCILLSYAGPWRLTGSLLCICWFPNTKQWRNTFLPGSPILERELLYFEDFPRPPLFWGFSQASFILRILPGLLYFEYSPRPPLFWGFSKASFILRFLSVLLYCEVSPRPPLFWGFFQSSFIVRFLQGLLCFEISPRPPLFWGFSQASFILRFLPGLLYFEVSPRPPLFWRFFQASPACPCDNRSINIQISTEQ
jgi:hypothetical protein